MRRVLVVHPRLGSLRGARLKGAAGLLRVLGIRLVLADDEDEPVPGCAFAERVPLGPPEDVAGNWTVLRRWMDAHPVDAVFAQTEAGLLLGSLAARHAGVRGPTPEAALACTSKWHTRRRLAATGVRQPSFALVDDVSAARAFADRHGFPLVLKAVASARQRLVTLVREPAGLASAVERVRAGLARAPDVARLVSFARAAALDLDCDPTRHFLVESFADGEPVESDGLLFGDERLPFGVVDQIHTPVPDFFIEGYLFPSDRSPTEVAAIEHACAAALRALGLADTGYSVELRVKDGEASIIEVNGRLGIDEGFGDLFEAVLGAQPLLLAAEIALGRRPRVERRAERAAIAYQCCYRECEVVAVPDARALRALEERRVRVALHARPGDRQSAAGSGDVRPHLASALARDRSSSRAAYARARAAVDRVTVALAVREVACPARPRVRVDRAASAAPAGS